uniref:MIF4G domain-containing protein n=1 Tax=Trichuris muris TaxID=70415 RepID=A0A5S6QPQ0_TRIMR
MDQIVQGDFIRFQAQSEVMDFDEQRNAGFGYPAEFPPMEVAYGPYYFDCGLASDNRSNYNSTATVCYLINQINESMEQCTLGEIKLNQRCVVQKEMRSVQNPGVAFGAAEIDASKISPNVDAPGFVPQEGDQANNNSNPIFANEIDRAVYIAKMLHAAIQNPEMNEAVAKFLEKCCLNGPDHGEQIKLIVRQMLTSCQTYSSCKVIGNLALLLDARVYIYKEHKSFMDYFCDGVVEQLEHRSSIARKAGVSLEMRFLMTLCAQLSTQMSEGSGNGKFLQDAVFILMADLLVFNSMGNYRAIVHVLTDYGEILCQRDSRSGESVFRHLQAISERENQISLVKELMKGLLSVKAEWHALDDPVVNVPVENPAGDGETSMHSQDD